MRLRYLSQLDGREKWALAIFFYVGFGAVVFQLRGALLPNIKSQFEVSESLLGLVAPAATLGFTAAALSFGMVAGRIDIRKYILIGVFGTAVTTFLVGIAPGYLMFILAIFLRGLACGVQGGLGRPLLGHLYSENRGRIYNLRGAVWALGASAGPLLATVILHFGSWRLAYIFMALTFVPVLIMMSRTSLPPSIIKEKTLSFDKFLTMLKNPIVSLTLVALFLNVGVEGGFFTWLPYFFSQHWSQNLGNYALAGFLAAYVPGRMLNSWFIRKHHYVPVVGAVAVIVSFLLILTFYFQPGYFTLVGIILTGLFISSVFPNLFSLATEAYPEHSGPVNGLIMTFDPLGLSLVPALMGLIADHYGITVSMRLLVVPMVGVAITMLVLWRVLQVKNS